MKNKRILIIGEAFFPEDFIINDLAKAWKEKGMEVEVLTRTPSYPFGKTFQGYKNRIYQKTFFKDIPIHRVPIIPGYQNSKIIKILNYCTFVFFASIVGVLIGRRFDKVFVYQTGPLTVALPGTLIKILFGKELTIWTQDLWPETVYAYGFKKNPILDRFLFVLVSFVYNRSQNIVVSCQGFSGRISSYLTSQKEIFWIPNWSIINDTGQKKKTLPGKFNFTFAGNVGKVQNLENVILAFKNMPEKFPDAWLNIVGDGSVLKDLKALVLSEGIQNVHFTGRRPLSEMSDFFRASDVLLISLIDTPIYEIMIPSKFQTYLNYERPIFAVMKGEVPNMISKYKIGISSHPSDIGEIEKGFLDFLKMENNERLQMGSLSKNLLNHSFNKEKNIESITRVLLGN